VKRLILAVSSLGIAATSTGAQVGHDPAHSPFVDVDYRQELSLVSGPYAAKKDPAGVAPIGGSAIDLFYAWRAGGPAYLTAELGTITSHRTVLDPRKPAATRDLGARSWPLYTVDAGLSLALTGAKSYHRFIPMVRGGVGVVSDFRSEADTGDFKFGTRFALSWGAGIRWVPGGRWQVRADWTNRLYTVSYPTTYYSPPQTTGGNPVPPILANDVAKSRWTNNSAFTLGLSYLFSR
jgi:hypothetical protein